MITEPTVCPSRTDGSEDKVCGHGACCATCKHCTKTGSLCDASDNPKVECLHTDEQHPVPPWKHDLWEPISPARCEALRRKLRPPEQGQERT